MKKVLIFIITLICLICYSGNSKAELLENPGFENGDNPYYHGEDWDETVDPAWWWKYGEGGWCSWKSESGGSEYSARTGDKLVGLGAWTSGDYHYLGQSVPVNQGETFTFSVWARTEEWDPPSTPVGGLYIEWKDVCDVSVGEEFLHDITNGSESTVWTQYTLGPVTAPSGTVNANIQIYGESQGSILFDDCSFFFTYAAGDEQPEDGAFTNPVATNELSWKKPKPDDGSSTIYCDVWFGTDANMPGTNTKILDHSDANSVGVSLNINQTYYWRVDCYDPSFSPEQKTEGRIWSFNTLNSAPSVEAGDKQAAWLSSGSTTVQLDATVSDDELPNPPSALTYTWTKVSGAGSVVFSPNSTIEDPNVTFTTAGDYILKLTASDSADDANDTVKIRVYDEGYTGLVAHWELDETSGTTAVDSIGSHNGTLIGTPVWYPSEGQVDGAIQLDGNDDYINCGGGTSDHNTPTWADFTEEITVSAWIKVDDFDANKPWQAIISKGDTAWRLSRAGNENVINFACNGLSPNFDVQGFTDVTDGKWHHIVGTYDGVEIALYVDGVLDIYSGSPMEASGDIEFSDYDVYIGENAEETGRELSGMIDEVRIYEIGLPQEKIVDLFRADDGKNSCPQILTGDINEDCYIDMLDFAEIALNWLSCNDVGNPQCD